LRTKPRHGGIGTIGGMNTSTTSTPAPATDITLNTVDGVATIVMQLARPKNAFRSADAQRLGELVEQARSAGARCVVLRGAATAFCAGWDISSIDPQADDPMAMIGEVVAPLCRRVRELPLPTIAAVAGPALGFGFGLAMCCDIVIAEEDALLGSPFRNIGMVPDTGTHHFLLSRLGHGRAAELIFTGRLLSGLEAAQCGLINHAVPKGAAAEHADRLARQIASGPTAALALSKRILQAGGSFDEVVAHESQALRECFATADLQEGLAAFVQKRPPRFVGR